MKTKTNKTVVFLLMLFALIVTPINVSGEISESLMPSESFIISQKQSIAASNNQSTFADAARGLSLRSPSTLSARGWGEQTNPFMPGSNDGDAIEGGNVGGPIGDATLPVVLSFLLLYVLYRTVSTRCRKTNL